jgi:hypothetical protein
VSGRPLFCLSCGLNHARLGDVQRGGWTLRAHETLPQGDLIQGVPKCEAGILYTLAAANGHGRPRPPVYIKLAFPKRAVRTGCASLVNDE